MKINDILIESDIWYHGSETLTGIDEFDPLYTTSATDYGYLGKAIYLTPSKWIAKAYARDRGDAGIFKVTTDAKRVKQIQYVSRAGYMRGIKEFSDELGVGQRTDVDLTPDVKFGTSEWAMEFTQKAMAAGYDGVQGVNADGTPVEFAVFDIKNIHQVDGQNDHT